jgi:hypothetical protein
MKVDVDLTEKSERSENKEQITQTTLLMPVWGYRFTQRFLEFCLPTLLAPNNLPALARQLPCRFILLSSESDVSLICAHPAWQKLAQVCAADIELIDDLITKTNHTATITLAFERALRHAGPSMRTTCFFFLMSDYLVADGSLKTVLKEIRSGASAVMAGNFQVIAEDAVLHLRRAIKPDSAEIVLQPRELVGWSLAHLHPATIANIVNNGLTHNAHTNRLFWQVDETALIGRFYLMHPIAIHPETIDFAIRSSWDYSFVPELCPSGNITALTDSDEYFVVELQRREYESENLRPGPIDFKELAASLSLWATTAHRANVEWTLLFHAANPPANLSAVAAQADDFVQKVRERLATPPVAQRGHPYWLGSLAMHRRRSNRPLNRDDWNFILNDAPARGPIETIVQKFRDSLFGFPPRVTRFHPWWPEYRLAVAELDQIFAAGGRLLVVAQDVDEFAQWVARVPGDVETIGSNQLLTLARVVYAPMINSFDACFLLLSEGMLECGDTLVARIAPLLKRDGKVYVLAYNDRPLADSGTFALFFASNAARLLEPTIRVEDIQYIRSSRFRWLVRSVLTGVRSRAANGSKFTLLRDAMIMGPTLLAAYLTGSAARSNRKPPIRAICSSIFVTLQVINRASAATMGFANKGLADPLISGIDAAAQGRAPTLEERYGVEEMETATSLSAQKAPVKFASMVAAYQFAASCVAGQHHVAEFGLTDAIGIRLMRQKVEILSIYDPRERVVAELQREFVNDSTFTTEWHDLLSGPTPQKIDSIYSIDFLQYFTRDEEDAFIGNLRASLRDEFGFALIGCPSFGRSDSLSDWEPAAFSPGGELGDQRSLYMPDMHHGHMTTPSAPGNSGPGATVSLSGTRIYQRSGEELVALIKRYFHNVFAFSMIEHTVRPGLHPNAQHVFALGSGQKRG